MLPLTIELAGAPKGKGRPRFVRRTGIAFTPQTTRSYEGALRFAGQEAMAGRPPLEGPLRVLVEARFPVAASWPRKKREAALRGDIRPTTTPDADNLLKMLDAFNEVVWKDDRQIVDARIYKGYSERPRLTVVIEGTV